MKYLFVSWLATAIIVSIIVLAVVSYPLLWLMDRLGLSATVRYCHAADRITDILTDWEHRHE